MTFATNAIFVENNLFSYTIVNVYKSNTAMKFANRRIVKGIRMIAKVGFFILIFRKN